jgi:RNA-directed DNA polymerase
MYSENSLIELATQIDIKVDFLKSLLEKNNLEENYHEFYIDKNNGKKRKILSPNDSLKLIHKKLNKRIFSNFSEFKSVHGFVKNKNIKTNASKHLRKKIVLKVDIENYFESINIKMISQSLSSKPFLYSNEMAQLISRLCSYKGFLPQGAPTSPNLSNIVFDKIDKELFEYAGKSGFTYTRYADDLTFSTNQTFIDQSFVDGIQLIIGRYHFKLNEFKTKIKRWTIPLEVTGIIVNDRLNVRRKYLKSIRAILHCWGKDGIQKTQEKYFEKYYKKRPTTSFVHSVRGKIEFVGMVRGKNDKLYRSFLDKYNELLVKQKNN